MINFHYIKNFIKHYWSATRIDVLHSPFIFDLYNVCIKPKNSNADFVSIENLDSKHTNSKRISQIIFRLVDHYCYRNILGIGTSSGIKRYYIAAALKKNFKEHEIHFTSIENDPENSKNTSENFKQLHLEKFITQKFGNVNDELQNTLKDFSQIDMAFVDGKHRYEGIINYFHQFLPKTHNDSLLIFDAIYRNEETTKAWEEIKHHPQVKVTVDLFFMGLVFFRKEQATEHFKLRVW